MEKHSCSGHEHHHHGHSHGGSLGHHHHHGPKNYNFAFAFGIGLNIIFVIVEALYGYFANSLALMADAGHNLSDVAGLILAWGAVWLTTKKPRGRYTYGFRKSSILSALFNAIILLIAVGFIIWEAVNRLSHPAAIQPKTVIIVALVGIFINGLTAMLFFKDKDHDINLKGAYLHMAADALISLGVVISGIIISYTSWEWLDLAVSLIIALVIIYGTWDLFKSSVHLSMDAVPYGINQDEVRKYLESLPDVKDVHDLHIWPISTTENALSAHLSLSDSILRNERIDAISKVLKERFKIDHPTLQFEVWDEKYHCAFKSNDVL